VNIDKVTQQMARDLGPSALVVFAANAYGRTAVDRELGE